ncbi:MAG: TonB-dependent receptor [Oceanicaulis sp. HLUCCA04]|nr:MAG: TonB-dependent receptor [Oceanicaulis sp. HLUCCA04]
MTRVCALALLGGACLAAPLHARQAEPDGGEVIVVSATRSAQERGAAAVPVAVIDSDAIRSAGAQHVAELLNRAPGVHIHRGNGVEHLTSIRSPVLSAGAGAGSFLYLEDGISLRAPAFANINGLFEAVDELASRVEIIRGPGGAVYGSNALHGLVNIITPDPADADSRAELEIGSFGRARLTAMASGATRAGDGYIGISVRSEDGWREDAALLRAGLQARLDWGAGATRWSLRASAIHLEQETATFVDGFEAYRDEAASRRNANPEAFRDARAVRVSLHADHVVSEDWTLAGAVYARSNDMDFRLHFLPSTALEETGHDSIGFQSALTRQTVSGSVTAGIDGEWTRGYLVEDQTLASFGAFPQGIHYDYDVEALTGALFVQGRQSLTGALELEGGARLETTRFDYTNNTADGAVGRFLRLPGRSDRFTTFAPHAGLVWQAADGVSAFARIARGVRAPQTDELYRLQPGQEIDGIEPEVLDSLEAGVRLSRSDGLSLELTGFTMLKRNVFFRDADGINVTDGRTTHEGIEIEGAWPVTDTLTLSGALTWAIHNYDFDRPVSQASEVILRGNRVDTAPEWLWNLRASWQPVDAVRAEAEWLYVGEYFADAANSARYDGHDILNLRASLRVRDGVDLFASVRNAADVGYAERADFAFGGYRYFPGEPRSVSVGVRLGG